MLAQDMHRTCLLSLFEIPKWRPPLLATQSKGPLSTYSSNEYADRLCPHSGPRSERVTSRPPPPAPGWSKKLFAILGRDCGCPLLPRHRVGARTGVPVALSPSAALYPRVAEETQPREVNAGWRWTRLSSQAAPRQVG